MPSSKLETGDDENLRPAWWASYVSRSPQGSTDDEFRRSQQSDHTHTPHAPRGGCPHCLHWRGPAGTGISCLHADSSWRKPHAQRAALHRLSERGLTHRTPGPAERRPPSKGRNRLSFDAMWPPGCSHRTAWETPTDLSEISSWKPCSWPCLFFYFQPKGQRRPERSF